MKKSCKNCDFSKNRSSEEPCCSCKIGDDYPNTLSHWKGSETEIVNYDDSEEFFEWKDSIESKFNKLSQENIELKQDLKTVMEAFNIHSHKDFKKKLNEVISKVNFISLYYENKGDYAGIMEDI